MTITATRPPKPQCAGQLELPMAPALPLPMRVTVNRWIVRDWYTKAACHDTDNPAFHSDNPADQTTATQQVCGSCPVRRSCLASALLNDEHGVWGGTTEAQRAVITSKLAGLSAYWITRSQSSLPAACRTDWTPGPDALDPTRLAPVVRRAA